MDKKTITVKIFGEILPLVFDETEEYILELATFVDEKLRILYQNRKIKTQKQVIQMIMLGLFISDELLKNREKYDALIKTSQNAETLHKEQIKAANPTNTVKHYKSIIAEKDKEIRLLKEKLRKSEQSFVNLNEKFNEKSNEETQITNSKNKISSTKESEINLQENVSLDELLPKQKSKGSFRKTFTANKK